MKFNKILAGVLSIIIVGGTVQIYQSDFNNFTVMADTDDDEQEYTESSLGYFNYWKYSDHILIRELNRDVKNVVIPAEIENLPVTIISENAFMNNNSIESVVIPNSVTDIRWWIFAGCSNLKEVSLGKGIETLGGYTFSGCSSLSFVTIPNSVKIIWEGAFNDCENLSSMNIPNSVETIKASAFNGCTSLKEIVIPKNVALIEDDVFLNCTSLESITILNPECKMNNFVSEYNGTIYGYKGSTAETYANIYGISFIALDDEITSTTTITTELTTTTVETVTSTSETSGIKYGDANCDGDVTIADAVLILQSIANPDNYKLSEQGRKNADVSNYGDGITASDALVIQLVEAKQINVKDLPTQYKIILV